MFTIPEARPKWQFLPQVPGYVPVYIRSGDTPLEEINPELAEAFHALPAGRSAGKLMDAAPEIPDQADQAQPELVLEPEDHYEKKFLEKKKKATEVVKPIERR
ncbi:hypothetical protein RR48_08827 [Papilio machaon]|uniref:Uncharacterized protein n=1 Tax=Papilio machaon TaxID=76193 RepID=A0A194R0K9_PAPMA|nr:hypothetical protein RR48_08827 [Papilio machaon]